MSISIKNIVSCKSMSAQDTKLTNDQIVVNFAGSDHPLFLGPDFFNKRCAEKQIMPAMVLQAPQAFTISGEFKLQKAGDKFTKKVDGKDVEDTAKSTSWRCTNVSIGMTLNGMASVMAASAALAQPAVVAETIEEEIADAPETEPVVESTVETIETTVK